MELAKSGADADDLAKEYGIKGTPLLSYVGSLSFPQSFPYDFMHLIWENLVPNLILHWTGRFKGLDEGFESYQLANGIWEAIGVEQLGQANTSLQLMAAKCWTSHRTRLHVLLSPDPFGPSILVLFSYETDFRMPNTINILSPSFPYSIVACNLRLAQKR